MLRIERLHFEDFRCFGALDISFEPDLTVLFAENGGGKTALLDGFAMLLALLQPRSPEELAVDAERDARRVRASGDRWEPAGPCTISCVGSIGSRSGVEWGVTASPTSRRRRFQVDEASDAIELVRARGERWPIIGYYGTERLTSEKRSGRRKPRDLHDRWDGYDGCLDPLATDGPLLDWLRSEAFGDLARWGDLDPALIRAKGMMDWEE